MRDALVSLLIQIQAIEQQVKGLIAEWDARARGPIGDDEPAARLRRLK